jgi:hypothetical protein
MASSLRTLAFIRRLYALGNFLHGRFKCLLFVLCRKLISWLMTVRLATVSARRRLGHCKDVVVSRKPKSAQPSWTRDGPPPASSLDSKRPTIAPSAVPASSSNQPSLSRASIRFISPDVGRFTSTLAINSRQGYLSPESTSRNSGTATPELTGDCRIDIIPLIPGESDGEKS